MSHFKLRMSAFVPVVAAAAVYAAACGDSKSPAAPTPPPAPAAVTPTLSAPQAVTPVATEQLETVRPRLEVKNAAATGNVGSVKYRFEVSELDQFPEGSRTVVVDDVPQGAGDTTWIDLSVDLIPNFIYFWRARATNGTITTDWSKLESFKTQNRGFRNGQNIFDPLLTGNSVGDVGGGRFIPGQGWQAVNLSDFINYDIPTMPSGSLEFDITGVESDEPGPYDIGMKFYSMGDGRQWDFLGFRNQPWKASLDKKSGKVYRGESGVVEHIFRVFNDDNRTKTGQHVFHEADKHHISLVWGQGHVVARFDNETIADEHYGGEYAPPNHRIALGCSPRTETLKNAIWSNVVIGPR